MNQLKRLSMSLEPESKKANISAISPSLVEILSPSNDEEKETLLKLDLGMLFQWILCFALVKFDLETGHGKSSIH
jgi:hypothetical protein